jgi:hypothetical protein
MDQPEYRCDHCNRADLRVFKMMPGQPVRVRDLSGEWSRVTDTIFLCRECAGACTGALPDWLAVQPGGATVAAKAADTRLSVPRES